MPLHPDGAIFPGAGVLAADIMDGLSHTIFTIETIDEAASRWTVGKEVLWSACRRRVRPRATRRNLPTITLPRPVMTTTWGENSGVTKAGLRTFLSYDFSPTGADAGKYEDPGFAQTPPAYGPSSMHPAVVTIGMGDGSVEALSKQVDAASLFFLITKNNSDPFYIPSYSVADPEAVRKMNPMPHCPFRAGCLPLRFWLPYSKPLPPWPAIRACRGRRPMPWAGGCR